MILEAIRCALLRRNSSILGHTTEEDEEITWLPLTMGHGVHHGPAVVTVVPFFLAFLLLYVHGIMRAPMVGSKNMVKKA